jgi:RHS repeat-associated protein
VVDQALAGRKITEILKPEGNTDALVGYFPSGEVQWRRDGEGNETSFVKPEPNIVEITDARNYTSIQEFDDKYRLVKETDPTGGVTQYVYDDDGNRIEVIDANLNNAVMTYDERGNMTSVTNGAGETSYFDYDSDDNLIGSADGRSVDGDDETYQRSFTYDEVGNKTSETDALGHTQTWDYTDGTEIAYDDGTVPAGLLRIYREQRGNVDPGNPDDSYATTYGYYGNGDLAIVSTPSGFTTVYTYDELGRLLTEAITDPEGGITGEVVAVYSYDPVGNVKTVTGPVVDNSLSGESHQLKVTNSYDDNSNLVTIVESDVQQIDPSRTTSMTYDNNDRERTVTDPEGGVLEREYDAVGNVTAVIDQNGNRTETQYDNRNLPTEVTRVNFDDGHGNVSDVVISSITYDDAGRKLTETDAEGRVTQWRYDDADRVKRVLQLGVSQFGDDPRDVLLSATTYDAAGNVKTQQMGTANHALVTNDYDESGRLVISTLTGPSDVNRVTTFGYDPAGNITQVSRSENGRTETTKSVFDVAGRLTASIVDPDGLGLTMWFTYDARGNQTETRDPRSSSGTDPTYATTTTYDILSRPTMVESPEVAVEITPGTVTQDEPTVSFGYDTYSNQTHTIDERDNETVSTFDGVGRVALITHPRYIDPDGTPIVPTEIFDYDDVGNLNFEVSRRGNRTDYTYDDANRVVRQTDPLVDGEEDRGVTDIFYNDAGDTVKTIDPERGVVEWTYDELGRVASETQYTDYGTLDEEAFVWRYGYDDLGNQTFMEDPQQHLTMWSYNGASELIRRFDIEGTLAEYDYDVAGRQILATDALGRSVVSVYDLAGRLTDSIEYDRDGVEVATTSYGYDNAGNQTSVTSPRQNTTEWFYDELSRLTSVEVPVGETTPDIVTSYGYDAAGNPVRVTDGEDNDWYTTYNEWNLQETIVEPETIQHPDADDRMWVIGYDAGGLPVTETQPGDVAITRVFDQLGRMTSETGIDSGVTAARTFGFDLNGRLTTVNHPSDTLGYTYDERGLMLTATGPAGATTFTYDEMGRMATREDPSSGTAYVFEWTDRSELNSLYDPVSGVEFDYVWDDTELDYVTYGTTGYVRDYSWDERGLLDSDRLENSSGVAVASASYEYDLDGNIDTENISLPGNAQSGQHSYEYDDAGRLTEWSFSNTDVTYQWDGNGNRIAAGNDTYEYDERNRLVDGPDGDYTYTPRGTLSSIDDGATTVMYGFDPLGRLVDYDNQVAYSYDGLDRVAVRDTDTFSYIGAMLDPVDDGAFTYSRTPGGRLVSQTDGTDVLLTGLDRHGDLTWLFDPSTGTITDTAAYDPYGDPAASTGSTAPTVGYQGDYTDPVSDEVWMGARWYSGADAVFRSRDTVFGELRTPISLNRYTYAWANPNTYWDPDGRYIDEPGDVQIDENGHYTYVGPKTQPSSGGQMSMAESYAYYRPMAAQYGNSGFDDSNPQTQAARATALAEELYRLELKCELASFMGICDDTRIAELRLLLEDADPLEAQVLVTYMVNPPASPSTCDDDAAVFAFMCGAVSTPAIALAYTISHPDEAWAALRTEFRESGVVGGLWGLTGGAVVADVIGFFSPSSTAAERGEATTGLVATYYGAKAAANTISNTRRGLSDLGPSEASALAPNGAGTLPAGESSYQLQLFPTEPYNRVGHYGYTPTTAQRAAVPAGMEFDHTPSLVEHYYLGPGDGSLPGFNLTQTERLSWAQSLSSGQAALPSVQRAQGALAAFSKKMKEMWGIQ